MRALNDRLLPLAFLDRLHACEDPSFVEAARLLALFIAPEVSQEEIVQLRSRIGTSDPGIRGPLVELLIELCPSDEPLAGALGLDETLLEDYVSALAHEYRPRDEAVASVLSRFAKVLGWPRVTRALFRSLLADDAVGVLRHVDPLGWSERDQAGLGEHRAAVVRAARMKPRTKLWRHLLAALTPEWRRLIGPSEFLTCCRSWDALAHWLDDALYGLEHHVTRGVLTATEADVLTRLRHDLQALGVTQPDDSRLDALGARVLRELCGDRNPLAVAHDLPDAPTHTGE